MHDLKLILQELETFDHTMTNSGQDMLWHTAML